MTSPRVRSFSNAGLTFDVIDEGPIDGPIAILLHGFPQRGASWNQVARILHGQGIRTLAPDQRGYSPAARPRRRAAYRLENLASDITALIEQVREPGHPERDKVHVVGHDWGAVVAWVVAGRTDLVASLTAVSVGHPRAFLKSMLGRQALMSWYIGAFQVPGLPERVLSDPGRAGQALRGMGMTPEMVATFHGDIVEYGALRGGLGWYRALPLSHPRVLKGRVEVPTTMVWSDRDAALGRRAPELSERYVDAPFELQVLEGVSHWVPDEVPDVLAEIVCERIGSAGNGRMRRAGH
ncbi:alpha/beta fold hydrolase [Nocardioides sp. AE5]|uniref:alpha/beta fold hydrolase n=1 Tax=Nocardioides sp. AE5 TaxID=2962573 RepID=UPI002881FDBA|nr:alpha/beta fold hydrolase [Nocardioides sp. AE5]MDT0203017.1 alpha/beta fold hydrolase [Nocardioides sp. AE5]